ncbi:MAG: MerR family transcriptional regulator [Alkalilacustris sp.]
MSGKAPGAFRTIGEVSELLDTPAHVLRFWESRFPQIKPVKRAGGRRYYRPADVELIAGIKQLLHDDGMTIRGVQKLLRERGVRHVGGLAVGTTAKDADVPLRPAPHRPAPPPEMRRPVSQQRAARPAPHRAATWLRQQPNLDPTRITQLLRRCMALHARLRAAQGHRPA